MALLYMGWANNEPSNKIKPSFRELNIIVWNLPALPCIKGIRLPKKGNVEQYTMQLNRWIFIT